jgi:hypothetical protein
MRVFHCLSFAAWLCCSDRWRHICRVAELLLAMKGSGILSKGPLGSMQHNRYLHGQAHCISCTS